MNKEYPIILTIVCVLIAYAHAMGHTHRGTQEPGIKKPGVCVDRARVPGPQPPGSWSQAPTDYTKTRQTIQSPNRQHKASKRLYKTKNIRQNPKTLDKDQKYLTRVANNNILTFDIKYQILETQYIN